MADSSISTETQVLHLQSQSPPPVSLDGSFDGTPSMTHDFDTVVVNYTDCFEDLRLPQQASELEKEVVLDSEDEGNSDANPNRRIEGNIAGLQSKQPGPTFPHLDDLAEPFAGSEADGQCDTEFSRRGISGVVEALIIDESPDAGKIYPQMLAYDLAELNYNGSEEAKESSQANALDFVKKYLALNNMDSSPGTKPRNVVGNIVSPVSRIKGCQSLAKQIKTRTPVGIDRTFEWVDTDHFGEIDFFGKRTGATFDFGDSLERPATRDHKAGHADFMERSSPNTMRDDYSMDLNREVTVSPSDSRGAVDRPKAICRFEQASETKLKNNLVRNSNKLLQLGLDSDVYSIKENASNMFDVGFSTQMAAEAMEALSYDLPTDGCTKNISQCPQNFLLDTSPDVPKSKIYFTEAFPEKSAFPNPEGIKRMSNQKQSDARLPWRHSIYHEFNNELKLTAKKKRSRRMAGGLNRINSTCQNKYSNDKSAKPGKKRTGEGSRGEENTKKFEDYGSSSIPFENVMLGKRCVDGEPVTCQIGHWTTEGKLEGKKYGLDNLGESISNSVKGSIITYKRKRSSLDAKPSEFLKPGGKCIDLEPFANQRHGMTGGELEETKDVPDSLGEGKNAIGNVNVQTYKRKNRVRICEVINEGKSNRQTQQKQCSSEVCSLSSSLNFNAWNWPKGKRMPRRRPSHLNEAKKQSTTFVIIDGKVHKKPYNKFLPKSSILKELIRLGIQEPKSDFTWKGLRKRRDASHVQVLFSQHLDDDVIKQQKKILGRLGISIASSSKVATHFVADKFVRTKNMLEAIALGKPVVTRLWLESCGQASCLIDEKNYILRDAKKEKEIGFGMTDSLARAIHHPLLKGRRVLITPNIKPDIELIAGLVKSVHGEAVEKGQISSLRIPDDLLILSCEEDHSICAPFLDKGAAVYSSELLLNGIVIQKLEYERHQLFTNRAKRIRRSSTR